MATAPTPTSKVVTLDDVKTASRNISSLAHKTPVITCETLNLMSGHSLFFKCENLQKTGAFKFRGAVNAIKQLSENERQQGVVTHSSGNHAAALAHAASLFGITAHIVMPSSAPAIKKNAVICYGCLLYTSPSPRDATLSRMPSSA